MTQGFFAVGVYHIKSDVNIGTLLRSAHAFGAAFIFTVGRRYAKQASDTQKTWRHVPVYHYTDVRDLRSHLPYSCPLIGVELDDAAIPLPQFSHPERAAYLLGAEDHGLSRSAINECHTLVSIPGASRCLNVASAGTIVLYDRVTKRSTKDSL